jgi:hypothetical protein
MPDSNQKQKPLPQKAGGGDDGPSKPEGDTPNVQDLLKKMRKVDPDQARRYRQRTGE